MSELVLPCSHYASTMLKCITLFRNWHCPSLVIAQKHTVLAISARVCAFVCVGTVKCQTKQHNQPTMTTQTSSNLKLRRACTVMSARYKPPFC
eukprot:1137982-Amphidinium_carterae.1